jgi:hypothetical protein
MSVKDNLFSTIFIYPIDITQKRVYSALIMTNTETMDMDTKQRIVAALTEYDRKQSTRRSYNHHALALYFEALDEAETAVNRGQTWEAALKLSFNDRVLEVCLRAIA